MKKSRWIRVLFVCALILGWAGGIAYAGFTLPSFTFNVDQLPEAQKEAQDRGVPITILYSDCNTTCPLCTSASNDVLYSLDKVSVIVYAEASQWKQLPEQVRQALSSDQAGEYIPITVIIDPDFEKVIYIIPYQRQNRIALINEAKNRIKDYSKR